MTEIRGGEAKIDGNPEVDSVEFGKHSVRAVCEEEFPVGMLFVSFRDAAIREQSVLS